VNFAHFQTTPTGREVTFIEHATGECVENAEVVDTPTYLCKGDGKWYLPSGGCKCKAGYEADSEKQTCNGKFFIIYVTTSHKQSVFCVDIICMQIGLFGQKL